ncbi:hypothetical protein JIM95_002175 [Corynebacterium sp. CCM 8835]|uniref:Uncharacterized protein n=1 Tax=Corynebacterium antarcticum TaxID=2800405 RepID=A0A9Q4GL34_9CORY|nr:hypothetical protein [Corynebacterium antarcticum]MCK7641732.1 hypothetical protein [Corynebacterium antarcticum]MCK7660172.1 hypothetical protein [Corynebacterium antarcticum]MCL0244961.1 hypothetical protein [Corynebacterium antarcticum]MCX7491334.1 hypothetical protein [Corynebacterium antarcticum]MCX7537353.1 hypothetical protein [Corynebacterium antarcticum]
MPTIVFDCLVPDTDVEGLSERFSRATDELVEAGEIEAASVVFDPSPRVGPDLEAELRRIYRVEHADLDMADASVCRYRIQLNGVRGSVNQLAMTLSRILTPPAVLPRDRVLLEQEALYERPATYPWSVRVAR